MIHSHYIIIIIILLLADNSRSLEQNVRYAMIYTVSHKKPDPCYLLQ